MRVLISMMILAEGVDPHEATTRAREGWTSERVAELKGTVLGSAGGHVVVTVPQDRAVEWDGMVRQLDLEECSYRETVRALGDDQPSKGSGTDGD